MTKCVKERATNVADFIEPQATIPKQLMLAVKQSRATNELSGVRNPSGSRNTPQPHIAMLLKICILSRSYKLQ